MVQRNGQGTSRRDPGEGGMIMGEIIEVGDLVDVYWENVECEIALKVLYIPSATGDSWRFQRTTQDMTTIYVQGYSKMVKK